MPRRSLGRFVAALSVTLIALIPVGSCSRAGDSRPQRQLPPVVRGCVSYGGQPVWEGRITLLGNDDRVATALLASDGTFTLINPPCGKVRVAISNHPSGFAARSPQSKIAEQPGTAKCVVPERVSVVLPERFSEPEASPWTVEIPSGENYLTLVVPRAEEDPPPAKRPLRPIGPDIGSEAPEIEGVDLDGQLLRLSDYRGKVVALVFWAHWCNLCRAELPHYQALQERLKDKPFVLLGVNCDPDREFLRQQNVEQDIDWRSWWDGAATGGPVTAAYQFEGFPAVMLIDDTGTIRHRNLRGAALDQAIDELVASLGQHK